MARRRSFHDPDETNEARILPDGPLTYAMVNMTDARSYGAGCDYFLQGAVHECARYGDRVVGTVMGTEPYEVELW